MVSLWLESLGLSTEETLVWAFLNKFLDSSAALFVENTWKSNLSTWVIIGESSLAPGTLMKPAITFEPSDLEAFYNINTLCGPVKYNSM